MCYFHVFHMNVVKGKLGNFAWTKLRLSTQHIFGFELVIPHILSKLDIWWYYFDSIAPQLQLNEIYINVNLDILEKIKMEYGWNDWL